MKTKYLILPLLILFCFSFISASWDMGSCVGNGVVDITNNQTHLFVLANDHNNGYVCVYDIETHTLITSYSANGDLGGITTDNTYLYIFDENSGGVIKIWNIDGTDTSTTISSDIIDYGGNKMEWDGTYFWFVAELDWNEELRKIKGVYQTFDNGTLTGINLSLNDYDKANGITTNGTHIWINLPDQDIRLYDYETNWVNNYSIQKYSMTNNGTHIWMTNQTHIFLYDLETMTEIIDEEPPANNPPVITTLLSEVNVTVGQTWNYDYNATDEDLDELTWSDNTTLFNIDSSTGIITFLPLTGEGQYIILITVSDGTDTDTDAFTLNILAEEQQPSGIGGAFIRQQQLPSEEVTGPKVSIFSGILGWFQNIINWFKGLF